MFLTQEILKQVLHYCPESGLFTWLERPRSMFASERYFRAWNSKNAGNIARTSHKGKSNNYYINIRINRKGHMAHRLAWLYVHGEWPNVIDHIDGNGKNNSIENLRNVSSADNARNMRLSKRNKSGCPGVCWSNGEKRWKVEICYDMKKEYLGTFKDLNEAVKARKSAEVRLGFHENHGRKS